MSATSRKRKEELAGALKKLILSKGKTPALKYQQLFEDIRGQSDIVSVYMFIEFFSCPLILLSGFFILIQGLTELPRLGLNLSSCYIALPECWDYRHKLEFCDILSVFLHVYIFLGIKYLASLL